ncbi:type III secretion protein [Pseudomonas sp. R2-60-08W]|uniref:type III secretion protein n=1 Tax=Pseudomonas sp. R2-60-08W TaxID=1173280 RepID=UPI000F582A0E|nr:type III secretion protein [Pseudomonas sp. R2-60-08W]AZF24917.1 type III secretion protein HrpG [Pseudomonas sp. R2-60-08W]
MEALIRDWLNRREPQLTLVEGDDEITLKRQDAFILVAAQLTSRPSDNTTPLSWLRLGAASLSLFQGALVRKADSGELWLIQTLRDGTAEAHMFACLETLLNQRDIWRATFTRLARPAQPLRPSSLRSLPY